MGNTELRRIPFDTTGYYYIDESGFLWRKLKVRPRDKGDSCYSFYSGNWFILIKPTRSGKNKNYLRHHGELNISIHRAVLSAFNPIENWETLQVNHKDRNTFNNHIDNLEWVTNKENCIHRTLTELPDTYDNLYKLWELLWANRHKQSEKYIPKPTGGTQVYDKDLIIELLYNTKLPLATVALMTGSSVRAVKYWQEKEKIERPLLYTTITVLLSENPNLTSKDIALRTGSLITSVNPVYKKVRKVQRLSKS